VCGYFSSTADRPAYGCFPENVGDDTVGHAHDFARALAATHSMPQAHAAVVRLDVTPDVPLRTSDLELERLVRAAASRDATPLWTTVARLLGPDWRQQPALRAEVTELDALAASFGLPVPLDLDALTPLDARLSTLERETATSAKVWRGAFGDATTGNLQAFLTANPTWHPKVADTAIPSLTPPLRAALGGALVSELLGFLKTRPNERLETLHARTSASSDTAYRMAVRRAVLLRVESRLAAMAGRALLASGAAESERAAYETLLACEDVLLPGTPRPAAEGPPSAARSPLPSLETDEAAHRAGRPAWIGIAFNDTPASARRRLGLPDGSATVSAITPGSPANQAGLQVGDILHGADGQPFAERRGIRTWTLLQPAETPGRLDVLRGEQKLTLTIVPKALPEGVSPPPPPPSLSVGATAPPFQLRSYRGTIAAGKPHLYYFWATWCKPCKAAVPRALGLRAGDQDADRGDHRRRAGRARRVLQDLQAAVPEGRGHRRAAPSVRRVRRVGHADVRAARRQGRRSLAQSGLFTRHRDRRRLEVGRQMTARSRRGPRGFDSALRWGTPPRDFEAHRGIQ
jgi:thiol-disulfide isomerase/thioredoxin